MHEDSPQRTPRSPRRTGRSARHSLATLLLVALLAACNTSPPPPPPPPPPGGNPSLTAPAAMNGVTEATLAVRSASSWRLEVVAPAALAGKITLSPTSGSGDATVTLTVDPEGLASAPDYKFDLRLVADGETIMERVTFSFPDVRGYALRRVGGSSAGTGDGFSLVPADAAGDLGVVIAPGGDVLDGTVEPGGAAAPVAPASNAATAAAQSAPVHELAGAGREGVAGTDSTTATAITAANVAAVASPDGTVILIVGLAPADAGLAAANLPGEPAAATLAALGRTVDQIQGAAVESRFDEAGIVFVEVPAAEAAQAAARLGSAPGVSYVELPVPIYPFSNDEFRHLQWNLDRVRAEQLWPATRGEGVTIAILDNGFYPDHPDLIGNVVGQYDAGDQKASVTATRMECGTHGTHVAGIAAAADNFIGVAGAAPGARLYLVDLDYESRPGCPMDSSSLIRGLQHVLNGGAPLAEVVNLSLGSSADLGTGTQNALRAAADAGIILVGAAGNTACTNGQDTNVPVSYPARYSQVWAVAATDPNDDRACYSHVGPELFIAAPGGDSWVGDRFDTIFSTDYDFGTGRYVYGWMEGTSMAAPMVAGVVALLKSAAPGASNEEIRQALIASAVDLGSTGRDSEYGYGLIDAPAAYEALTDAAEPPPPTPPDDSPVYLSVPGYGAPHRLDPDGIFTLVNAPVGTLTIRVGSDENGNGIIGEPGEYLGEATINVEFDQNNQVVVELVQQ